MLRTEARSRQRLGFAVSIKSNEHPSRLTLGRDGQQRGRGPWAATKQHVSFPSRSRSISAVGSINLSVHPEDYRNAFDKRRRIVGCIPGGVDPAEEARLPSQGNRVQSSLVLVEANGKPPNRSRQVHRPERKKDRRQPDPGAARSALFSDLNDLADLHLQRPDGIPCN